MKKQFKVSYYLRSNYENKEGKNPIMVRIILDGEMVNLGSSQLSVKKKAFGVILLAELKAERQKP